MQNIPKIPRMEARKMAKKDIGQHSFVPRPPSQKYKKMKVNGNGLVRRGTETLVGIGLLGATASAINALD